MSESALIDEVINELGSTEIVAIDGDTITDVETLSTEAEILPPTEFQQSLQAQAQSDWKDSRDSMKFAIKELSKVLPDAVRAAKYEMEPKTLTAVAGLAKTIVAMNETLLKTNKMLQSKEAPQEPVSQTNVQNNNYYTGSPQDILDEDDMDDNELMKERFKED